MKRSIICLIVTLFAVVMAWAQTTVDYTYDNLNRLTEVKYDNGVIVTYTYDALGNRTKKTLSGATGPKEAYAWLSSDGKTLTFCFDSDREERVGTTYELNEGSNNPDWNLNPWNNPCGATLVVFEPSFAQARPVSTYGWFQNFSNLIVINGLQYLNTSIVTTMRSMFEYCVQLTEIDASHFDTKNVTDMSWMFDGCNSLISVDVSGFNTSNVTTMMSMFDMCRSLTNIDVSHFNTSKVENFSQMFVECLSLISLDVSHFDTSNAVFMGSMFDACISLTSLDVSHFNTSKVESMSQMFWACQNLKSLDVSNFDTHSVTTMRGMFNWCSGLTSLDVSSFDMSNVTESDMMFNHCESLNRLSVSSSMEGISSGACEGVGNTTVPCTIVAPDGFDFSVDTSGDYFVWKSGYFKLGGGLPGDADGDGKVSINDVTALIQYLLSGNANGFDSENADCYSDGRISIDDITALINYLLTGTW